MKKNIIFDLDGTLWDSSKQIAESWSNILTKNNIRKNISKEDIKSCLGKTNDEICELFFNDIDNKQNIMITCEKEEIKTLLSQGAYIYDGVITTLNILSEKYNLYIVSNCQQGYIESFLTYYNLKNIFTDYISSGDTKKNKQYNIAYILKKHKISNSETVYVGDTIGDYIASTKNNLEFIFASYGFGFVPNSKYTITKIEDILSLLNKIEGN